MDKECLPVDRALGVEWSTEDDSFRFHVTLKPQTFTRRAILSIVASVYDPIGFLAPFIFTAKYILQELCKLSCGWDDEIPSAYHLKWQQWLVGLRQMEAYKVNRCIKPKSFGAVASAQLHNLQAKLGMVSLPTCDSPIQKMQSTQLSFLGKRG